MAVVAPIARMVVAPSAISLSAQLDGDAAEGQLP